LLLSTTIPIPKGRNSNLTCADNYRGITLGSIFGRVFDLIVLLRYEDHLSTCDLQFGFKHHRFTNMCTMLLKEVISYYTNNDSSLYCVFLDVTKAFDKVEYCALFRELINEDIPPMIIRVLLNIYTGQQVHVLWNGVYSNSFYVSNGVKQGAVISPVIFCIYYDNFLLALRSEGIGCHIGGWFVGAVAYADDIVLFAPSANGMRRMLSICDGYAAQFNLYFNATNSKCLFFRSHRMNRCPNFRNSAFVIGDKDIEFVEKWSHLGHTINVRLDDDDDIYNRKIVMIGQANNLLCSFSCADHSTKNRLFQSYCCSHYGCELWDLNCTKLYEYCSAWRKALGRIWDLPNDFRSDFLPPVTGCVSIFDEIARRTLNFISDCLSSNCNLVCFISNHAMLYARSKSFLGRNAVFCCLRYGLSFRHLFASKHRRQFIDSWSRSQLKVNDFLFLSSAIEIMMIRDGVLTIPNQSWSQTDLKECLSAISACSRNFV
jgi:hypothetical protein